MLCACQYRVILALLLIPELTAETVCKPKMPKFEPFTTKKSTPDFFCYNLFVIPFFAIS